MFGAHRFTKQDGAGSPFTAESKAEQCARNEHLRVVLREAGDESENSKPRDRDLQRADAAIPIGDPSGESATYGRH